MSEIVEPKPQFCYVTKDAVLAALDDPDPANPIAIEIAGLVTAYTSNFQDHVKRLGYIPADLLRVQPRWPIEAIAMSLTTEAIRETVAQTVLPASAAKPLANKERKC